MRRIKITPELLQRVLGFNRDIFSSRNESFEKPLKKLERLKLSISSKKHKAYLNHIIGNYSKILNATPIEMLNFIDEFEKILPCSQLKQPHKKKVKKDFYKLIVEAMRYEAMRDKEFPRFLFSMGIKSCIYCNAQSTLTIELKYYGKKKKKVKDVQSKLQLDHFYPKSKYPFLSTSFFNLYPTCSNCNLAKGTKDALFQLYTTKDDQDEFHFEIDDKSILRYWIDMDIGEVSIEFKSLTANKALVENHRQLFKIDEIYDANKDIAEELIVKAKANPESYRKMLSKSFTRIFPNESLLDRLLIGNYSNADEIFKRSYSKYTQDIARQLKLLK